MLCLFVTELPGDGKGRFVVAIDSVSSFFGYYFLCYHASDGNFSVTDIANAMLLMKV